MHRTLISKDSLHGVPLIRVDRPRVYLQALFPAVPVLGLFYAFVAWVELDNGVSWWGIAITGLLVALFSYGILWVGGPALSNFAISLADDGVPVYDPTLRRQRLIMRSYHWGELGPPKLAHRFGSNVVFWSPANPVEVTANQSRAILHDARHPLRHDVPTEVARRVGIERSPPAGV